MILQRYTFGSKSQLFIGKVLMKSVAYDIAKIYIWKQITTGHIRFDAKEQLLMILQRYTFGSKSQPIIVSSSKSLVAYDIAKIYIWKQITTICSNHPLHIELLMILQRYTFGSKSQL